VGRRMVGKGQPAPTWSFAVFSRIPQGCDPLQLPYKGRTAIRFSLRHLGISLDAGQPCLKSPGFNPSALTAAHVQLVLVMYTPSFRPFVSEIVIRWSGGATGGKPFMQTKRPPDRPTVLSLTVVGLMRSTLL
jgi:hypothetical protein